MPCVGPSALHSGEQPGFVLSRWLFLKLLGFVYLVAFVSLLPQVTALVGVDGLLPVTAYLERTFALWGEDAYIRLPTLLWLWSSDVALLTFCGLGVAMSLVAMAGFFPVASYAALWGLYLTLTIGGQDFLSFQWDTLLLETGLVAVLYAPSGWRSSISVQTRPSALVRWLLWSLAFKLTFLSGVTKLLSGDATWRGLTALRYHYETQPLPHWFSWYFHHAPDWFGSASLIVMFAIEIVVPFTIFFPPRWRRSRIAGCVLMCFLQLVIVASGNYGFFNLLTIVLYLALLDDRTIASSLPGYTKYLSDAYTRFQWKLTTWSVVVKSTAAVLVLLSTLSFVREIRRPLSMPGWSNTMLGWVAPLRSVNGYGLFRTMTTERPEIVIEGSIDGIIWREYEFKWKVGDVTKSPRFVQPYMPRVDWQMWFAALDPRRQSHWLIPLAERLRDNDIVALSLIDTNPFVETGARYVRLALYRYTFSGADEDVDRNWWRRDFLGYLTGPMSSRVQ